MVELPLGTIIGYKSLSKKIRYAVALKNALSECNDEKELRNWNK